MPCNLVGMFKVSASRNVPSFGSVRLQNVKLRQPVIWMTTLHGWCCPKVMTFGPIFSSSVKERRKKQ
eukprot:3708011-Pleurochrysis_carterae.AAC.5